MEGYGQVESNNETQVALTWINVQINDIQLEAGKTVTQIAK